MPYATPRPLIGAVQINTYTNSVQGEPWAAVLTDGRVVVTWESWFQDGDSYGAYARILDSAGNPVSDEIHASTTTAGSQQVPTVAALSDGGFVIVWQTPGGAEIVGQRFDASGAKVGGEFQISTSLGEHGSAMVTGLSDGGFLVSWRASDGDANGIFARRFDASTTPAGPEFQINTYTSGEQRYVQMTQLSNGNLIFVWESEGQDGSGLGVYGRLVDSSGTPIGAEFLLSTTTSGTQRSVAIEAFAGGGFIATWVSADADGTGIFAQRFDNTGAKVGAEFRINTTEQGAQEIGGHVVAARADGGFVALWVNTGEQTMSAQLFDQNGAMIGHEFEVATDVHEVISSVHALPNGDLFFTWAGNSTDGEVYGRVFYVPEEGESWTGTNGNDAHTGTDLDDILWGRAGQDTLSGGDGSDTIYGGNGDDVLNGNAGDDTLLGEAGHDQIDGGAGHDIIDGGNGDDTLIGGSGDDDIAGAAGRDTIEGGEGHDGINGGSGDDIISGGTGDDVISGAAGHDVIDGGDGSDSIDGGNGDDSIDGGDGDDLIAGGAGFDVMDGGEGADQLFGDAGQDRLHGGTGDDILTGGAGADTFVFGLGGGTDQISDFGNNDHIEIAAALFTDFGDVLAHATEDGGATIIQRESGESIVLSGVSLASLNAGDFIFV